MQLFSDNEELDEVATECVKYRPDPLPRFRARRVCRVASTSTARHGPHNVEERPVCVTPLLSGQVYGGEVPRCRCGQASACCINSPKERLRCTFRQY